MALASQIQAEKVIGRYRLFREIASGGMGSVYLGKLVGEAGFHRTVAIKRLHPQFAKDRQFVEMLIDEARLAGRIRHPNVVPTIDVIAEGGELLIVMEYVHGESLSGLLRLLRRQGDRVPPRILASIMCGTLYGLHAAHEACDENGNPLQIVHRDVSPQNILVGVDGVARVVDFGVAKAANRLQVTQDGVAKGKVAYMAPEQLGNNGLDRRVDVFAASVVLWECLVGKRLFLAESDVGIAMQVLQGQVAPPGSIVDGVPPGLDDIVMRGLAKNRDYRWSTALQMSEALESTVQPGTSREVSEWVKSVAAESLLHKGKELSDVESSPAMPIGPGFDFHPDPPARTLFGGSPRVEELPTSQLTLVTDVEGAAPAASRNEDDVDDAAPIRFADRSEPAATVSRRGLVAAVVGGAVSATLIGVVAAVLLTRMGGASGSASPQDSASALPNSAAPVLPSAASAPDSSPSASAITTVSAPSASASAVAGAAPPGKRAPATAATSTSGQPKAPATSTKKERGRDLLDDQL